MAATETTTTTDQQLTALQTGAGIYPLDDRAFLRITGADATRWLNGMATNNIKDLKPGEGNYNFLLNSQGRIQADCTIYREPGEPATYLLETSADQLETIQQHLDKFIIMDDVELAPGLNFLGKPMLGMALIGANASALLQEHVAAVDESDEPVEINTNSRGTMSYANLLPNEELAILFTPAGAGSPTFNLWLQTEDDRQHLRKLLEADGAIDLTNDSQEALRILEARPKFGQDIRDKDLPQETAQTHALHFSKGCYLGQEIVERIHSRGQVHRTFTRFTLTGDMPQLPAILESNGKPVGELTSAALIHGQLHALGYLRREAFNQPLTYPGGTATQTPRPASNSSH